MKETFFDAEIQIILFPEADIISTSGLVDFGEPGDDELPALPMP